MKKLVLPFMVIMAMMFASCNSGVSPTPDTTPEPEPLTPEANWAIITFSLEDYNEKFVSIDFSSEMKVTNNTGNDVTLRWQLNIAGYPTLASQTFKSGTSDWVKVCSSDKEKAEVYELGTDTKLYLSSYGVDTSKVSIKLRNEKYTVTVIPVDTSYKKDWLSDEVPSLKKTYSEYFDSMGLACEYASWNGVNELSVETVRNGLSKHVDSISMGNEFKPDGFFGYQWSGKGKEMVNFTASSGLTIQVPKTLQYTIQDNCMAACKEAGLKMRGHVLAWHAQTPDNFFAENYEAEYDDAAYQNVITNKVSKEVMNARLEWYIKTVLNHVADWEKNNNNGEHIIWAWDVFNETVADDANETNWVRGSTPETKNRPPAAPAVNPGPCGSRWYQVYGDTDFIVDAFRFANAYAPSDVKLCYNDYNEYMGLKTDGILSLIKLVKNGPAKTVNGKPVAPRIDVMGLQSHVGPNWPGVAGYESALNRYLELVDCHVTEFDISATSSTESKNCYAEYFNMLKKYGKKSTKTHSITNVTIWGINNKTSWIYKDNVKYPLLFDNYKTTESFWAVINAAE